MTRPVTVYTVSSHKIMSEYNHVSVERRPELPRIETMRPGDEYALMVTETVKMRVKEFRRAEYEAMEAMGGMMPGPDVPFKTERAYIAVDPALEKYLRIEWDQEKEELEARWTKRFVALGAEKENVEKEVLQWWSRPWYARVWSALKGNV